MIFSEWTAVKDWLPPYGKPYMLLIEDEHGHDNTCQICTIGFRSRTDIKGECFRLITDTELYTEPSKTWDKEGTAISQFVTHSMELPSKYLIPERLSKSVDMNSLMKSARSMGMLSQMTSGSKKSKL